MSNLPWEKIHGRKIMAMTSSAYELGYLTAGLEILEAYLLSNDVYWTLSASPPPGEPEFRQFTLGGLLLNERRLQARTLPASLETERQECYAQLKGFFDLHRVALERKASREFQVRLKLWASFLNEYRDDPENHAYRYAYEVERRVMLQLMDPYARGITAADQKLLASLDRLLGAVLVRGAFIWEADVTSAFKQADYWYLYGELRK